VRRMVELAQALPFRQARCHTVWLSRQPITPMKSRALIGSS
jgi:hypothetical protein